MLNTRSANAGLRAVDADGREEADAVHEPADGVLGRDPSVRWRSGTGRRAFL